MTISSMSGIANADPKNEVLTPFDLREQDVVGSQIIPIFSMGIFNPLGPTIVALNILSKPDNPSVAFLFTQLNPFEQQRKIFARGSQETEIFEFMSGLYLIGEEKILGGPPDFIALATDIVPVVNSVQKLVKTLLQETVTESDLRKSLRSIQEHWGEPWNRIPRLVDAFGDAIQNPEKIDSTHQDGPTILDSTFSEWYDTLQNPEYFASELGAVMQGWNGSIKFQGGTLPNMPLPEALGELADLGHPVFQELVT